MADSLNVGTKTLVDYAISATPYNAIGYGLALALLIVGISALWIDRARLQKRISELQDRLTKQSDKHLGYVKQLRNAIDEERKKKDG
jgi:hypothetical protein